MDINDPNVVYIFMPGGPDGEVRWKMTNGHGDVMWQRIFVWTIDSEPLAIASQMLQRLVVILRTCHERDFGH